LHLKGEIMYRTFFPGDLLSELDRLHRQIQRYSSPASSIRGFGRSTFPPLNIGSTPESVEIFAFAPGLDPASIDVTIERGVLTLTGDRKTGLPSDTRTVSIHTNERFSGQFHRTVSLSDDVDPAQVTAKYNDGIVHISIKRRESAQRRHIEIQ
jgi:HSP20 family protein